MLLKNVADQIWGIKGYSAITVRVKLESEYNSGKGAIRFRIQLGSWSNHGQIMVG